MLTFFEWLVAEEEAPQAQTPNPTADQTNTQKVIIYPKMQGVDNADNVNAGEQKVLEVKNCIGNEPGKDFNYFKNGSDREKGPMNEYVGNIVKSVKEKGANSMPPVKAIRHPLMSGKYLVIDGNHRLGAFKVAGFPGIKAIVLKDDDILLAVPGTKWSQGVTPKTIPMMEATKQGVDLKSYFNTKELMIPQNDQWVVSLKTQQSGQNQQKPPQLNAPQQQKPPQPNVPQQQKPPQPNAPQQQKPPQPNAPQQQGFAR